MRGTPEGTPIIVGESVLAELRYLHSARTWKQERSESRISSRNPIISEVSRRVSLGLILLRKFQCVRVNCSVRWIFWEHVIVIQESLCSNRVL